MCGLHYLCLVRLVAFMRVGKKLSCSIFIVYIDTQGRGVHGPDERLPANDGKRFAGGRP